MSEQESRQVLNTYCACAKIALVMPKEVAICTIQQLFQCNITKATMLYSSGLNTINKVEAATGEKLNLESSFLNTI